MEGMAGIKNDGHPYKILIVDDSPIIHKVIRRVLEPQGFEICACGNNGKEGVELYKNHRPDLVTMDITMPIKDGIEAGIEILEYDSKAKIIMLSSMGDDTIVEEAKKVGMKHFATKPFNDDDFISTIVSILNE